MERDSGTSQASCACVSSRDLLSLCGPRFPHWKTLLLQPLGQAVRLTERKYQVPRLLALHSRSETREGNTVFLWNGAGAVIMFSQLTSAW